MLSVDLVFDKLSGRYTVVGQCPGGVYRTAQLTERLPTLEEYITAVNTLLKDNPCQTT